MEYTILKLSQLAKISTRTLRYYDEINLLKPCRINSSGYRIYGKKEINTLQQIMFYKELGLSLQDIKKIILSPDFNEVLALKGHHEKLLEKRKNLDILIKNVENTLLSYKGEIEMTAKQKFEGFKQNLIEENEKKYGTEIRKKYGNDTVDTSNNKFSNMTEEEFNKFNTLGSEINTRLINELPNNDHKSNASQEIAKLHKEWLMYTWASYSKEAHAGLAIMYVEDPRFKEYYDSIAPGACEFLRDIILEYTK